MADQLGLTEYAKEMARWNKPYVHVEFPKMLYRGLTTAGRVTLEERIVTTEGEEALAQENGWWANPQQAKDVETRRQEAVGTAAAERADSDRKLSPAAQAEAAAADQAAGAKHLGEIPERKKRPRGRPFTKKPPPEPGL